jgi:hypothetical protein
MELLKTSAMLKALVLELQKYDKIEVLQTQVINWFYIYSWVLGMSYFQEVCNISSKTKDQKCSLVDLSDN